MNTLTATPTGPGIAAPASALAIVAHPDDAEFQCGGTLASWARRGCTVHHLVLTDGSKGTWDPDVDQGALIARRQSEQRAAARALGATGEVVFLGRVDGELGTDRETVAAVSEAIRRLRPSAVLGHDPWRRYRLHPDHEAAGRLAVEGIVAARDPLFLPEQLAGSLEPHRPDALLLFEPDVVNHLELISEADLAAKLAALEAHESQLESTHFYRLDAGSSREAALAGFRERERSRCTGVPGAPQGTLAEPFHLIVDQL